MYKFALAASALFLCFMSASAQADSGLPSFANEVLGNRVVSGKALRRAPVKSLRAGDVTILLEKTTLGDIAAKFGGAIQNHGDADDTTYWLCYLVADKTSLVLTFVSGELGGDDHAITVASAETGIDTAIPGCSAAPATLTGIDFGVPGLGSPLGQITKVLGRELPDAANRLRYNSITANHEGSELQTLTFRLQNNLVTGVAVTQAATD